MSEEYDSKSLRERSRKTARKRVAGHARSAKAITAHVREHGMLRKEEFLESLKSLGETDDGFQIPEKLVPKPPT
jgi:hypothetical protein